MHNHGGEAGGSEAWLNLLPLWLQLTWVGLLALCTAWAVIGAMLVRGPLQVATGLHVLFCVGMIDMFAPWAGQPARTEFWKATFVVASVVAIAGTVRAYRRRHQARTGVGAWLLISADCLAMAYMFQLVDGGISPLTYALITGFVLLSLGWANGVFDTAHAPMCRSIPSLPGPLTTPRVARAMQASMAASMAYMFVLMDPRSGEFFGQAFTVGITAETYWALAFLALGARMVFDPRLVRQLMGGFTLVMRRRSNAGGF